MTFAFVMSVVVGGLIWLGLVAKIGAVDLILGALVTWSGWRFASRVSDAETGLPVSRISWAVFHLFRYLFFSVLPEILRSTWQVIHHTLRSRRRLNPGIVAIHIKEVSHKNLFLLCWSLTLSPGEQVIAVDEERKIIYVHALDAPDSETLRNKVLEQYDRYVKEVLP